MTASPRTTNATIGDRRVRRRVFPLIISAMNGACTDVTIEDAGLGIDRGAGPVRVAGRPGICTVPFFPSGPPATDGGVKSGP